MAKYEEVASDLRRRIIEGEVAPGDTLPRYEELTAEFGVGRGVVSNAIVLLEREGLVRPIKRKGIVVQERMDRRRVSRGQVISRDPSRGYVFPAAAYPGETWQVHGRPVASYEPVPEPVANLLDVEPGVPTLRRRRITSPTGEPAFQVVDTWVSASAVRDAPQVAEPSTGPGGYLDRLEEAGHGPMSWSERIRARMPSTEEARLLEISPELPVLETTIIGRSGRDESAIEVTVRIIPADRVELVSELHRHDSATWPTQPVTT